jgi:hypothetical protein
MLVVWKRDGVVSTVTVIGSSVRDKGIRDGLRSIAIGDGCAGDNAAIKVVCLVCRIRCNTNRSTHDAFNTFEILEKR